MLATSEHIHAARPQVAQAQPRLQLQGGLPRRGQHLHAGPCAGLAATHLAHQPVRALPATPCRTGDFPSPNPARPCFLACSAVVPTLSDTGSRRCNGFQAASQHLHAADARPLPAGAHALIPLTINLKALRSVHTLSNQSMQSVFHVGGERHGACVCKILGSMRSSMFWCSVCWGKMIKHAHFAGGARHGAGGAEQDAGRDGPAQLDQFPRL